MCVLRGSEKKIYRLFFFCLGICLDSTWRNSPSLPLLDLLPFNPKSTSSAPFLQCFFPLLASIRFEILGIILCAPSYAFSVKRRCVCVALQLLVAIGLEFDGRKGVIISCSIRHLTSFLLCNSRRYPGGDLEVLALLRAVKNPKGRHKGKHKGTLNFRTARLSMWFGPHLSYKSYKSLDSMRVDVRIPF